MKMIEHQPAGLNGIVAVFVAVGWLLFLSGCSRGDQPDSEPAPTAVRVMLPQVTNLTEHVTYVGTVRAAREFTVSARVEGTVLAMPVAEGERMNEGDEIVTISTPDRQPIVDRMQADYAYWEDRYAEDKRLAGKGAIPREQLESSRRAYKSSQAALEEAAAQLSKASERAPFGGMVLKHFVEPGETVAPGRPLLQIGGLELEIHAEVVQEDLESAVRKGMKVLIRDDSGGVHQSQVSDVASFSGSSSRVFTVKVPLPGTLRKSLRVGEAVTIDFVRQASEEALTVPVSAVLDRDNNPYLFVVRQDRALKTHVDVGIQQGELIAVDFDWNGSDAVAVSNVSGLTDSARVYPVLVKEGRR